MLNSTFYVRNRQRLLERLEENSLVFLYSGLAPVKSNDQYMHPFSVNRNFYYLTGIDTQGVWLVLAKTAGAARPALPHRRPAPSAPGRGCPGPGWPRGPAPAAALLSPASYEIGSFSGSRRGSSLCSAGPIVPQSPRFV